MENKMIINKPDKKFKLIADTILIFASTLIFSAVVAREMPGPDLVSGQKLIASLQSNPEYTQIEEGQFIKLDLRYATTNNFTGKNLYGEYNKCFLHREAAAKLLRSALLLQKIRPGWKLLIFDCLRPRSVQHRLFNKVKGTPQQSYVANPVRGSIHNYGFAVDLSLVDEKNQEVDMGTPFDSFNKLSRPDHEQKFLKKGSLNKKELANRKILRDSMEGTGFIQLRSEWWHFDAQPPGVVRSKFSIVE